MERDYIENTRLFAESLKKEKAYIDYRNYRDIIKKNNELSKRLDEYMKKRFDLHANNAYGNYSSYGNLLDLQREYDDFLSEPLIQNYLKAELKFSKLLNDVFELITEEIDFDLDFLD